MKTGDSRTLHARSSLSKILKNSAFVTTLPIAQRLSPCSVAIAALAGNVQRAVCTKPTSHPKGSSEMRIPRHAMTACLM